ncbi:Fe-S cluster assembly protein SufD [Zhengella mangrovi]|uniref:Fe-S cluster assembly protein SufD n=1 Tax=Zhengella mangrovi TaxID=1982044 RepID=A0A2G1QRH7_9HYPH|nr:Fe-S cluster assembly protein SufD [Zhengella mangrovi]PHP68060.1 Fe-S cluster assembly protein SufD [Zhengella mangrovi]
MNIQTPPKPTPAEQALIDGYGERFSRLAGNPDVVQARDLAFDRFRQSGLPTRRVEAWHYTDLRRLLSDVPAYNQEAMAEPVGELLEHSAIAIAANGQALQADDNIDGVTWRPLTELLADGSLASSLAPRDADDMIGALNASFVSGGWALDIEAGAEIDVPLEIQNVHGGGQVHTRFPVTVGAGAKAVIVERQTGQGAAFVTSLADVTLDEDATVDWIVLQEQPDTVSYLSSFSATLGRNARLRLFVMNAGGRLVREEVVVAVQGEGADFQLRTVNLLAGEGHTDLTMVLDHTVPSTTSTEVVRNVVTGKAKGVFQGRINVHQVAQKTDARMACNTLLMSDDADFSAKPELEIFADDVACGHGATVAEINHDHLFYLMARGISEKEARRLLVKAFVAEVIEELDDEALVEALEARLDGWFADNG